MEDILSILIAIGGIALFIGAIALFVWGFKCVSQKNSIMEVYEGFFTISGAYFYLTFSVMRFVVPVVFVGSAIASSVASNNGMQVGYLLISLAAGIGVGLLLHLLKRGRDKQLKKKYGPVAAKEISKVMIKAGVGAAFSMAFFFVMTVIKETLFQMADPHYVSTTDGGRVYVASCGNGTYVDRHGNTYTSTQVQ